MTILSNDKDFGSGNTGFGGEPDKDNFTLNNINEKDGDTPNASDFIADLDNKSDEDIDSSAADVMEEAIRELSEEKEEPQRTSENPSRNDNGISDTGIAGQANMNTNNVSGQNFNFSGQQIPYGYDGHSQNGPYMQGGAMPPQGQQYYNGWQYPPQGQPPYTAGGWQQPQNYGAPVPPQTQQPPYGGYNQNMPPQDGYYGTPYGHQGYYQGQWPQQQGHNHYQSGPNFGKRPSNKKNRRKNIGLRVFICILVAVIIAGTVLTGIYIFSQNSGDALRAPSYSSRPSTGGEAYTTSSGTETEDIYSGGEYDVQLPITGMPETTTLSASEIANKVMPSVVGIIVYSPTDSSMRSWATGIVLTEDGYIVTNDHIYADIPDAKFIIVTSDSEEYDARFIDGDARSDLAVLKIDEVTGLVPAEFGDSDNVAVGEEVIVIGNPYSMSLSGSVTKGIVSAVNRRVTGGTTYTMKLIQTDAAINPGNSGGPLVNLYGQIVGINSSKILQTGYEGIGFSIPSTTVKRVVESLMKYGYVENRAKLGISFQNIDYLSAKQQDVPEGLYIMGISEDSDLAGSGISTGDIITHIDGQPLSEISDFMDIIESKKPGDKLSLKIYTSSNKSTKEVSATLLEDRGSASYVASK